MAMTRRHTASSLVLVSVLTLAAGIFSAPARLGETRDELTGPEGRYGAATGESTPALKESFDKVDVFFKKELGVEVEYDSDGKVWRISYRKKELSETLITNLLTKNGGERKWSKPVTYRHNRHWVSDDKELHAVYYGNPVHKLVIMTKEAIKAERRPQKIDGRTTKPVGEGSTDSDEPEKESEDPLEGF